MIVAVTGWSLALVSTLVLSHQGPDAETSQGPVLQEGRVPAGQAVYRDSGRAVAVWAEGTARDLLRNQDSGHQGLVGRFP